MVLVHGPIAGDIRGIAGFVFTEFVSPKVAVWRALAYPVFVHVSEEVELAEGARKVLTLRLLYGGMGVPEGVPVVVFGEAERSYCRL
jgi:hypothetical protein